MAKVDNRQVSARVRTHFLLQFCKEVSLDNLTIEDVVLYSKCIGFTISCENTKVYTLTLIAMERWHEIDTVWN